MQWNLIRLRKEAGLSQADMAEFLGINKTTYSHRETGKYQFQADEMFKLKGFFGKSIDEIFLPTDCNVVAMSESKGG